MGEEDIYGDNPERYKLIAPTSLKAMLFGEISGKFVSPLDNRLDNWVDHGIYDPPEAAFPPNTEHTGEARIF